MDRRHFLKTATLGMVAPAFGAEGAATAAAAGLLSPAYFPNSPSVRGLKTGLRELGFEEGRDLVFAAAVGPRDPVPPRPFLSRARLRRGLPYTPRTNGTRRGRSGRFSPRHLMIAGRWRDHERWALPAEEWRGQ